MMNNAVHCEEEDDGDIGDSVSFDLHDENSYVIQLEQFPPLPHSDLTAIASDHLDQINYIYQQYREIPNSGPPNLSEMFGNNPVLTQSQAVAVVDEVCDWESDQGELQPGTRNRSCWQIEEVMQKQKRPISISQTSILSDNSTVSLPNFYGISR